MKRGTFVIVNEETVATGRRRRGRGAIERRDVFVRLLAWRELFSKFLDHQSQDVMNALSTSELVRLGDVTHSRLQGRRLVLLVLLLFSHPPFSQ